MRVVQQTQARGVAHVGTFQRGERHADDADPETVLGDRLAQEPARQGFAQ